MAIKACTWPPPKILAAQHFTTFSTLLAGQGVTVGMLTGATAKHDTKSYDITIGTHALLYNPRPKEVALVVIDEQHRFGVEQRASLLAARNKTVPHLLTMTATPIPRTLALTLFGDLAIATLDEQPNPNKKITTKVVPESARAKAYDWINHKNEPTFIVCPLIDESESESLNNVKSAKLEFDRLKTAVFTGKTIGLLHGRMSAKEKAETIQKFRAGKTQILVSTPVIEVGMDMPDATIIVIESAERYGLASLHQLRGRVGRGSKEGFCFIFMSNNSKTAYYRLKHLETITRGMTLAELDMKNRGQGDIFGTMQHGFKNLKLADIGNLELLEQVKLEAQSILPELSSYPKLQETARATD